MTGRYNFMHTSAGKNDECWTECYAVKPLLKYLEPFRDKIIWCPFDTEDSEFVKVFKKHGYKVIYSHIWNGQDFFTYEPKQWDIIISNPPFTGKKQIFERAISFNKPFCLLMTVGWLNDAAPAQVFRNIDLQFLFFEKRMQFKNKKQKGKINFNSAYFCRDFLPKPIIWADFSHIGQQKLL